MYFPLDTSILLDTIYKTIKNGKNNTFNFIERMSKSDKSNKRYNGANVWKMEVNYIRNIVIKWDYAIYGVKKSFKWNCS